MNDSIDGNRQRDASSLRVLASFFIALGGLVLVGTLWALDNHRAMIVNLASGAVLVAVGGGTFLVARAMVRRQEAATRTHDHSDSSSDQRSAE